MPLVEELDHAFNPRSIAVAGLSENPSSKDHTYILHLMDYGFQGRIYPVNPKLKEVMGHKAYPALKDIPDKVDYVICCLPGSMIIDFLKECPEKGVKVVHLFAGRFSETGQAEAVGLEEEILHLAHELDLRLIGPNCLGIYNPGTGISFSYDLPPEPGKLSMFFQSGGFSVEFIHYASLLGIHFSKVISYGNALDVDEADLLDYFANDEETELIGGYIEGIRDGRKFLDALARASAKKPVILLKAGRGKAGSEVAASHTAALAGSHKIWDAAVKQAGAVQAKSMEDLLDLVAAFNFLPPVFSTRVGMLGGGGGGKSVLSADEWEEAGFSLPTFPPAIEKMIQETLPEMWWGWLKNPIDSSLLPWTAMNSSFNGDIMKMMAQSEGYDLVVVNFTQSGPFSKSRLDFWIKKELPPLIETWRLKEKPLVAVLNTGALNRDDFDDQRWQILAEVKKDLTGAGVPVFTSASQAASSVGRLVQYYRRRKALLQI